MYAETYVFAKLIIRGGVGREGMGVTSSWPIDAISGVRTGPRQCLMEGAREDDRHTDAIHPLYNDN